LRNSTRPPVHQVFICSSDGLPSISRLRSSMQVSQSFSPGFEVLVLI
jgi:hypothetical protein